MLCDGDSPDQFDSAADLLHQSMAHLGIEFCRCHERKTVDQYLATYNSVLQGLQPVHKRCLWYSCLHTRKEEHQNESTKIALHLAFCQSLVWHDKWTNAMLDV